MMQSVHLAEFAQWAIGMGLSISAPLLALAPLNTEVRQFSPEVRERFINSEYWDEREFLALCLGVHTYADRDDIAPEAERNDVLEQISAAIRTGDLAAERAPNGNERAKAVYGGMWRIEPARAVRWALGKFPRFPEWLARSQLRQIYAMQEAEKQAAGRYTLSEAAQAIASAGERFKAMEKRLCGAAETGDLPVYGPGELARYQYPNGKSARPNHEETYWDELNIWLEKNESRITFRFPEPTTGKTHDRVIVRDLAWEISKSAADAHPEHWSKQAEGKDDSLRSTIVAAMNHHGWLDEVPGVLPHIERMLNAGEIAARSTFNDFPASDGSMVAKKPESYWLTKADADKVRAFFDRQPTTQRSEEGPPSDGVPPTAPAETSKPSTAPMDSVVRHILTKGRSAPLSAEISQAKCLAIDSDDPASVWAELVKLAENGAGSLIGHSSDGVQYRGAKHQATGEPDVFTLKNLRDRLQRAKARKGA